MSKKPLFLLVFIATVITLFKYFGLGEYVTLESIKQYQSQLNLAFEQTPIFILVLATAVFTFYAALPVPGLILLTLLLSASLGFWAGFIITSFGAAIGGTIAFWLARWLGRDLLTKTYPNQFNTLNSGVDKNGIYFLVSIRLVPLFPFFLVNSLMGLTSLSAKEFYMATQGGMLISSAIFANAGKQLSNIHSMSDVFTPTIIISFTLMGAVPVLLKLILNRFEVK